MKKTITTLTAIAALAASSFAPAAADMNPQALWNHAKPAVEKIVNSGDCAFVEGHSFKLSGLKKGADLAQVKKAFARTDVQNFFKSHLEKDLPKNAAHSGPGFDSMMDAYVDYAMALTAQRANDQCHLLNKDYKKEIAAWVAETNKAGIAAAAKIVSDMQQPAPADKDKPAGDENTPGAQTPGPGKTPKEEPNKRDESGSSFGNLFQGFSS